MVKSLCTLMAASFIAVGLSVTGAAAQSVNTPVVAQAASMNAMSLPAVKHEIATAKKPLMIVAFAKGGAAMEALFAKEAALHPEMEFIKVDASAFGLKSSQLPALAVLTPPSHFALFQKFGFSTNAADIDGFVKARIAAATKFMTLDKQVRDMQLKGFGMLSQLQQLYKHMKPSQKAQRIALNQKLSKLFGDMAAKQRAIVAIMKSERAASGATK